MSAPKFTPGPLAAVRYPHENGYVIEDTRGRNLADVYEMTNDLGLYSEDEIRANAKLWAAAPDLYAACRTLIAALCEVVCAVPNDTDAIAALDLAEQAEQQGRLALAKADGEAQP